MSSKRKPPAKRTTGSVRQLVTQAEKGIATEAADRASLAAAYEEFIAADGYRKDEAGRKLIREIFGKDAIAGDLYRAARARW